MKSILTRLVSIPIWVAVLSLAPLKAEDIYVAQTAQGSDSGASAANAHSAAWFNAAANWGTGTGKIGATDTVHLFGTISSALTVQAGGASGTGNAITIKFELGAKLSAPHWTAFGALNLNSKSFLVIDGGTNGLIEATDNGTAKTYQVDTTGIFGEGSSNVTIQNLTIRNLYDRTAFSTTDSNRYGVGMDLGAASSITIQNCILSGGDTMIGMLYATGTVSNWAITGNLISNCNHGISIGCASPNAYLTDLTIANNTIDHLDYWGPISGNHLDGMIIFNEASDNSGSITNLYIYGNTIGPNVGTINTAAVFLLGYVNAQMVNVQIYNNLFKQVSPYSWSNGFIRIYGCTNSFVVNNTFVSYDTAGSGTSTGIGLATGLGAVQPVNLTHKNNIYYSVGTPISFGSSSVWPSGFMSDYNVFYDVGSGSGSFYGPNYAAGTWSYWQGQGYDNTGHSSQSKPTLDASYVPTTADTVARDRGTSLSSHFTIDKVGTTRSGAWDIGAYENGIVAAIPPSSARTDITVH